MRKSLIELFHWSTVIIGIVVAFWSFATVAASQANPIIAHTEILYPFQYRDENQRLTGSSVAVLRQLFAMTGHQHEIRVLPWARAFKNTLNRKNSLIFSIARTPERESQFHWIGKIGEEQAWFWGKRAQFDTPVTDITTLLQRPIAVTIGTNSAEYVDHIGFTQVTRSVDADNSLKMLLKDRTHLIIESHHSLKERASRNQLDISGLFPVYELQTLNSELYIAFNKGSDLTLVAQYRNALAQLKDSGQWQQIIAQLPVGEQVSSDL